MKDAGKATTLCAATFLPWNLISRRQLLHSWFFTTLREQQRILYQSNPSSQKEQDWVNVGWIAHKLISEACVSPVSDLHCIHHSFLLITCQICLAFLLTAGSLLLWVQRYMEVQHSLLKMAWSSELKGGRQATSCCWHLLQQDLSVINRDSKPEEEKALTTGQTLVCYSVSGWTISHKNSFSCPTAPVMKHQSRLACYEQGITFHVKFSLTKLTIGMWYHWSKGEIWVPLFKPEEWYGRMTTCSVDDKESNGYCLPELQ